MSLQLICNGCNIVATCKRKHTLTKNHCYCKPRLQPRVDVTSTDIHRMQKEEHALRLSAIEGGGN